MQKNVPLVKQNAMKLEVFILGRQRIEEKEGMRRGRERIEKGSREKSTHNTHSRLWQSPHMINLLF